DESAEVIRLCLADFPQVQFFPLSVNSGNCRAFNYALRHAEGDFVIDLAADDVLMPNRIAEGVRALTAAGPGYGVDFCDAYWTAEDGSILYRHSDRFPHSTIPQGDVYTELIERFFICSPAMIFRIEVIRELDGYDETLAYEDFDFWIRSSRRWLYHYTPNVLVRKRIVKGSMSQKQFSLFSPQLDSTYRICEKILALNRSLSEQKALARRIRYEMRVCLRLFRLQLLLRYGRLLIRNSRMVYPD
ncbi:MAG: glycosyltransferase, partial [Bacteroidota bacterium]|nr:glycosyltransferase [Bacteroidota bacterium]